MIVAPSWIGRSSSPWMPNEWNSGITPRTCGRSGAARARSPGRCRSLEVAVRQQHALGSSARAACVEQAGDVVGRRLGEFRRDGGGRGFRQLGEIDEVQRQVRHRRPASCGIVTIVSTSLSWMMRDLPLAEEEVDRHGGLAGEELFRRNWPRSRRRAGNRMPTRRCFVWADRYIPAPAGHRGQLLVGGRSAVVNDRDVLRSWLGLGEERFEDHGRGLVLAVTAAAALLLAARGSARTRDRSGGRRPHLLQEARMRNERVMARRRCGRRGRRREGRGRSARSEFRGAQVGKPAG